MVAVQEHIELSKAMDCFGNGVCNMKSRSPDGERERLQSPLAGLACLTSWASNTIAWARQPCRPAQCRLLGRT